MDTVNVQQQGRNRLSNNRYVIVPNSNFSCNGRITGYVVSLRQEVEDIYDDGALDCGLTSILIWSPLNTERTVYQIRSTYTLDVDNDINSNIATKIFTGNNRIEFQSGDVIGYRHRSNACYRVWNIETTGYISYTDSSINDEMINIADGSADVNTNRQPLIQVTFGMTPLQSIFVL